jgi:sarcosine oxidase
MSCYDVVVVGLGVTGSAAVESLARRGRRVVGIERFTPGHDRGSSHGATRIIRLGYFEHPSYVPLLRVAYRLWREIESRSGRSLLTITGIIEIGAPDSDVVAGTLAAARLHHLDHEILDAAGVMRRFPAFRLPHDFVGVFQREGGFIWAEPAIEAILGLAREGGAELRTNERVLAVEPRDDGVRVRTDQGEVEARCAIVAAGAWLKSLLPSLPVRLRVTRQVPAWFAPRPDSAALFASDRFPVFILQNRDAAFYGFPRDGASGVKVAKHGQSGEAVDPDDFEHGPSSSDVAVIRDMLAAHLPAADGPLIAAQTCLYTMTPDGHFIVDRLPAHPQIIVASPCSGHGFKFAPVTGEILADLATTGTTSHDVSRFSLARFQ